MSKLNQLDQDTINKIAAGEVVSRPASALKELLENSLDAKSSDITIHLQEGGLSRMEIIDNGTGIHQDDFPILCKRFTTSKISQYDDLKALSTFGFRGEALSSISQVASVTVRSKKADERCAFKGVFGSTELLSMCPDSLTRGTNLTVENFKTRRDSSVNEHRKCFKVVTRYALNFPQVAFTLSNDKYNDFSSTGGGDRLKVIMKLTGSYPTAFNVLEKNTSNTSEFEGVISNHTFNKRQQTLILFINDRLVCAKDLKQLIRGVYSHVLRNEFYFAFLSIRVPAHLIDVNIHPNKSEVFFIQQSEVFNAIQTAVHSTLTASMNTTNLTAKTFKPVSQPSQAVRVSSSETKLDWFYAPIEMEEKKEPEEKLRSVHELKEEILANDAQNIFNNFTYVGCVDSENVLIQYKTSLYLCKAPVVLEQAVYQFILDNFASLSSYEIEGNLPLEDLFIFAESSMTQDEVTAGIQILERQSRMLEDYFGIVIKDSMIKGLPLIMQGMIQPSLDNIPEFAVKLAFSINWEEEKACLEGITRLLSWVYSRVPDEWEVANEVHDYKYYYKNCIFPYLRGRVVADSRMIKEGCAFLHLVSTETLYKIFERC